MRPIKFRAWDTLNKKMIYDVQFKREDRTFDQFLNTRYAIMQFTGLHDTNNVPIFEGDIVVQDGYKWFDDNKPNYRGTVEWIYSQWQVLPPGGINEGLNDEGIDEGENTDWEVLGNIYENPELLSNP